MRSASPIWATLNETIRPQARLLPAVIILGLVSAAFEGAGIGLVIPMLSIIMGPSASGQMSGLAAHFDRLGGHLDDGQRIVALGAGVFALILLKNLFSYANGVLTAFIYGRASHMIRMSLCERLLVVGYPFLKQEDPGRLLNIISNESWRVSDAVNALLSMVTNFCAVLILFVFLVLLSWQITACVVAGLLAIQFVHGRLAARLKAPSRDVTSRNGQLASRMLHLVHAGQLIRLFGQEPREEAGFQNASDAVRAAAFRLERQLATLHPLTEVVYAALFLSVVLGAWRVGIAFPLVVGFVVLLYRAQPYVRSMQNAWSQLQALSGSIEEVRWLLDPRGKSAAPEGRQPAPRPQGEITFDRVGFAYASEEGSEQVLRDMSFRIPAGKATGLVGRSGAGKTTIVNLLCRLLEPQSGTILIDGEPLSELEPGSWRGRLAVASQDLELVDGTILENITYGRPSADLQQAEAAAEAAEALDFIQALPEGFETIVGYRGVKLSAGQRQRIALARALVRNPDVLILDEATNAVDGLSEAAILATLGERAGKSTTIVISHHRATLEVCDEIVVLKNGTAIAQTSFAEVAALGMDDLYEHRSISD